MKLSSPRDFFPLYGSVHYVALMSELNIRYRHQTRKSFIYISIRSQKEEILKISSPGEFFPLYGSGHYVA